MKRNIVFRGFSEQEGRWIYGYYINNGKNIIISDGDQYEVIEETVGQCIELYDVNEVSIFEGDKLTSRNDKSYDCSVRIRKGAAEVYGEDTEGRKFNERLTESDIEYFDYVIVGNIYENL